MAITEAFQASVSVGVTEYFCASASTTVADQTADGVYQTLFDLSALAAGDTFRIRVYEAISSAGTRRQLEEWTVSGVQVNPIYVTPTFIFLHKWEFSLTKIAGTDRSISWSIRKVA